MFSQSEIVECVSGAGKKKTKEDEGSEAAGCDEKARLVMQEDGSVMVVGLSAAVFRKTLAKIGYDDPASVIGWNADNVNVTVANLNASLGPCPQWLGAAYPVTAEQLMVSLIVEVCRVAGGGGVVHNFMIAPNTTQQYAAVYAAMCLMGLDQELIAHVQGPLGHNYMIGDRSAQTRGVAHPVLPPTRGVAVFR